MSNNPLESLPDKARRVLLVNCAICSKWKAVVTPPADMVDPLALAEIVKAAWNEGDSIEFSPRGKRAACLCEER